MKLLFIGTEVSLKNSPEGIVSRSIIEGFIQNNWAVDLISPHMPTNPKDFGVNQHHIISTGFLFNKLQKKISGVEGGDFLRKCCEILEDINLADYNLIFLRSDPVSIHSIALHINKKYGIRCVCSFGDVGSVNPYYSKMGIAQLRKKNLSKIEREIIKSGNIITQTNSRSISLYEQNGFDVSSFFVLPNPISHASQRDSTMAISESSYPKNIVDTYNNITSSVKTNQYNFAFLGSLYGDRKPDQMFNFFSQYENVSVHIFGGVRNILYEKKGFFYRMLKESGLNKIKESAVKNSFNNVHIWPFMPMPVVSKLIEENFDAVINIDANFSPNPFLSSKVVQYISYDKPVINFSNTGATTDLLEEAGITYFVDYQPTIKNIPIENLLRTCTPSIDIKDRYTAKSIVGKFLSEINL